ncbi:hypothetical protein ACFLZC_01035 [Patescibacteria group bacterium]
MNKKIKIYGSEGYVGKAVCDLLVSNYQLIKIDPSLSKTSQTKAKKSKSDLAIICVPTPQKKDGACDISIVEEVVKECNSPLILIKSTIPPGTTKKLKKKYKERICFSPEYIGEGNYFVPYWKDYPHPTKMKYHSFQIFGGDRKDTNQLINIFQPVMGPDCRYFQTDSTSAELVKYTENLWLGTKVTFCNEVYRIAKVLGVDYNDLREMFIADGRVGRMHTMVTEGNFGFGGKCLPKDINALAKVSKKAGYIPEFVKAVLENNDRFRKDN